MSIYLDVEPGSTLDAVCDAISRAFVGQPVITTADEEYTIVELEVTGNDDDAATERLRRVMGRTEVGEDAVIGLTFDSDED